MRARLKCVFKALARSTKADSLARFGRPLADHRFQLQGAATAQNPQGNLAAGLGGGNLIHAPAPVLAPGLAFEMSQVTPWVQPRKMRRAVAVIGGNRHPSQPRFAEDSSARPRRKGLPFKPSQ